MPINGQIPLSPQDNQSRSVQVSEPAQIVKIERDRQQVTVEGFRTLGIVSTFVAGVESQCLGVVSTIPGHPKLSEAASALLLIGLLLSSFGAALSLLSARWFDLLRDEQVTMLEYRWECARNNRTRRNNDVEKQTIPIPDRIKEEVETLKGPRNLRDYLVAKSIGFALILVFCGFYTFIVGMVLYTWMAHVLITAIVTTVVATFGTILLVFIHLDFDFMGVLNLMSFERIRL